MTDAPNLLPCPFCGSEAVAWMNDECIENMKYGEVYCANCNASVTGRLLSWTDHGEKQDASLAEAAALWNTRSDLIPALLAAERRKALEEAAKLYGDLYAIYGADRTDQFATGFMHGHDNHRAAIRALMKEQGE